MIRRNNGTKDRQHKIYGDYAAVPNFHHRFLPKTFLMSDVDSYEYDFIGSSLIVYAIIEQKLLLKNNVERPDFKTIYDRTFYKGSSGNLAVEQARLNTCPLYLIVYDIADSLKKIYRDGTLTINEASKVYEIEESHELLNRVYVYKVDTVWTNWLPEYYDFNKWVDLKEPGFIEFMYNIRGKRLH